MIAAAPPPPPGPPGKTGFPSGKMGAPQKPAPTLTAAQQAELLALQEAAINAAKKAANTGKPIDIQASNTATQVYQAAAAAAGVTPQPIVPAAGWSKTKKAVVFGGGAVVLAVVVAGGTKAAGLW